MLSLNCNFLFRRQEKSSFFFLSCPETVGHRATQEKMGQHLGSEKKIHQRKCSTRKIGYFKMIPLKKYK